jgi:1-deoxy-D-xylulose-5-phosphate synthase
MQGYTLSLQMEKYKDMAVSSDTHILNQIDYPADLRKLPVESLPEVCSELRQYIIDVLSENPGHLGASLGTVELTVALHYVFNTPYDCVGCRTSSIRA